MHSADDQYTEAREIGRSRRRVEDGRLVRGAGRFVDDIPSVGALHAVFVRSPFAFAGLASIGVLHASSAPGVAAVLTKDDIPDTRVEQDDQSEDFRAAPAPILVTGAARHVGEPVAVVIAETAALAFDAAGLVEVRWEPWPAISSSDLALQPGAPLVHAELGTNLAFTIRNGTPEEDIAAVFRHAERVVGRHLVIPRIAGVPIQPLAVLAEPDLETGGITIWCTTQMPWKVRSAVALALGLTEDQVRAVAPDVGGGFGVRGPVYGEYLVVAHAARLLRRPVQWSATRSEDMMVSRGARDVIADAEIAGDRNGRILGIRARVIANLGAYADGPGSARRILELVSGPYAVECASIQVSGVYTNTTPTGIYRGAGRPEASYIVERLVDGLALEMSVDPAELRRQNFVPPDGFPYRTPLGITYDSGNYGEALESALRSIGYAELRTLQTAIAQSGGRRLIGLGIASYVEPTAAGWESGRVKIEHSGQVVAYSGSSSQGQGHQTTFAQIVADRLQVRIHDVTVRQSDTGAGPPGVGTYGSRSTTLGGGALNEAAGRLVEKARNLAAHVLGVEADDIVHVDGGFAPKSDRDRVVTWGQIAATASAGDLLPDGDRSLEATSIFQLTNEPTSYGTFVVQVAVDLETGEVVIERAVSVDDCGTIINPMLLEGQSHGGLAQGLGAALFEEMRYDDGGQLLTGTLMDYPIPRARDLPRFEIVHIETRSPLNPLGVKGHAESGAIAAPPAVVGAVIDALAPLGITTLDPPLTPFRVWQAIQEKAGTSLAG